MNEFNNIKKNRGFKVPDDYFNNFKNKIIITVNKQNKIKPNTFLLKYLTSIAAVFIGVVIISWVIYINVDNKQIITQDDYIAYVEYNIDDISDELLYEITINDNYNTEYNEEEINYIEEEISEEDILDNFNF